MTDDLVEVRHGRYHDSVTLLSVSRVVAAVDGVAAAQVAMATPLNLDVLATMGFDPPATAPDDLVVAVRFETSVDDDARSRTVDLALAALEAALRPAAPVPAGTQAPPRTTAAALAARPSPLVLVSVPGAHAAAEAWDALDAGSSVMLFSDNVALEDEISLKDAAAQRGLLVMGPDCGTAVVGGVGLGFANVVRPGPVDLVAASGTGAQHLMSLLDAAGVGVRHCLGLGGRDLGAAVGGRAARQALRMLASTGADEGPRLVVLVSKPADANVVAEIDSLADELRLDLVWAVLGEGRPDLTVVAEQVLARLGKPVPVWPTWVPAGAGEAASSGPVGGLVHGLFAGGTLCDEAMVLLAERLGPIASNVPLGASAPRVDASGPSALSAALAEAGHAVVDLGDDTLTVGRAHPMIDPSLRLEALAAAAADPRVRVVLLDVVLGHGAHADPAGEHVPAIEAALAGAGRPFDVVVSLVGTSDDPQGLQDTGSRLAAAGASVFASNARAARAAADLAVGGAR